MDQSKLLQDFPKPLQVTISQMGKYLTRPSEKREDIQIHHQIHKKSQSHKQKQTSGRTISASCTYSSNLNWKPENRNACPFSLHENKLYMHGGIGTNIYEDVHYFDLSHSTWHLVPSKDFIGFPRYFHAQTIHFPYLLVFGGICKFGKKRGTLNDIRAFDLQDHSWDIWESSHVLIDPRYGMASYQCEGFWFIIGGYSGQHYLQDIQIYDIVTRKWLHSSKISKPNSYMSMVLIGEENWFQEMRKYGCQQNRNIKQNKQEGLWLFGGRDEKGVHNRLQKISLSQKLLCQDIQTTGQIPSARVMHAAIYLKEKHWMVIQGGKGEDEQVFQDLHILDVAWQDISCSPRAGHSIHVYRHHLILLGGFDNEGYKRLEIESIDLDHKEQEVQDDSDDQETIQKRYFEEFKLDYI